MVEDIAGLGKVAEVILNSVGKAIGTIIEPWQVRRIGQAKADVEAYTIEKKAEADAKAALIRYENDATLDKKKLEELDIKSRAGQRIITQEIYRQNNIESIVLEASVNAKQAEYNGAEARNIENDWINAFLEYAQNVSNEELQNIWARILLSQAIEGEPTVSKATLDSIRLIEPSQAILFERAAKLYLAMGQIMDVQPLDGVDIGYFSHMQEATALEDLGLLKRVRDVEENLEIHGGILTFWRDVVPGDAAGDYVLWTSPSAKDFFLERMVGVARGAQRDHGRLREPIRIDRQILTSRGFELASIIIPNFYSCLNRVEGAAYSQLGDFSSQDIQDSILNQWALNLSAQGAAVTFSQPIDKKDYDLGRAISFDPKAIFNPDTESWEKIEI